MIKFAAGNNKMLLTYKKWLLITAGCCFALGLKAQTHAISGFVCTRGTSVRLNLVQITDLKSKATAFTDEVGTFTIKAAIGDTLQFTKDDYTTTFQPVTGLADMVVFMQAVIQISNVTIKGQTKQQELNSIMDDYRKKGVYYGGKPSALSMINSPLNGLYSLFGRDPKNARRFAEYAKNEEEAAQDSRKYNKAIVKKVTGLPDEEVQKFMDAYHPSHEDLLKWSDYDVIAYIKKYMDVYKKEGAVPLPKLVSP